MSVVAERFPNWRQLTIHESSPVNRGVSRRLREECRQYIASQYFLEHRPGEGVDGVRCENLEKLTFEDSSIDLHITQDVFEHVLDPTAAFSEIARTLRQGGAHIFTVPLVNKEHPTSLRAQPGDDGTVIHLKTPEYHRNPVDPQGSLVTIDWGFDIVDQIENACGLKTEIVRLDDLGRGIRAEYIEVLVTTKA